MSKKKIIELIKMPDLCVREWAIRTPGKEIKEIFIQALKDQDLDTRHGCAEAVNTALIDGGGLNIAAHAYCMNYQDKDLEGL